MVYVWTGQSIPTLRVTLWLVCIAGFFSTFSILGLVLYRVSGKALLDNIRQVLVIVILLFIAVFARKLGFYGVLAGLAVSELSGMLFMLYAVSRTFEGFHAKVLVPDAVRVTLAIHRDPRSRSPRRSRAFLPYCESTCVGDGEVRNDFSRMPPRRMARAAALECGKQRGKKSASGDPASSAMRPAQVASMNVTE